MSRTITTKFEGLAELTRKLRATGAATQSVFREAAEAGAMVIQRHANANAPGPHIGIEVKVENTKRAVASVGPEKEKWFYRFHEKGTVAHRAIGKASNVNSRSFKRYLKRIGRSDLANTIRPMMRLGPPGTKIFAHRVQGVAKRPFLEPAIQRTDEIVEAVGEVYLRAIKEKTG